MPAGLGFLKGLNTALDTYQDTIERQKKMQMAQIELQQKQVELQAMQQQAKLADIQGRLNIYGDMQDGQPQAPPVQPYTVNQPPPQQGGMPMPGGGLPGARPMPGAMPGGAPNAGVGMPGGAPGGGGMGPMGPQGGMMPPGANRPQMAGPPGGGMPPQMMGRPMQPGMQPGQPMVQPGMQQPGMQQPQQGGQPQGIDSLPPPPTVQSIAQSIAQRAQQQGMQVPPGAIMQLAQKAYPQAMQQWTARREQLQYLQTERDRQQARQQAEEDKRLSREMAQENHNDSMAMRQSMLSLQQQGLADRGWTIVTGKDGKIYRANAGLNKVEPMTDAPAGMAKLGGNNAGAKTGVGMLMQKWKEEHPNYTEDDMQDFLVNNARLMTSARLLAQKSVPLDQLSNETRAIIPVVNGLSDKVDRTQYPSINRLIEAGEKGTGDTNVIRLGIAVGSVRDIYARLLNGGGAATDSSRSQANNFLDEAWSKGQIAAATDQIQQELDRAQSASRQTARDIMQRPGDSSVPRIQSDADYAKLPSGAEFIAPDGSHRRKP